MSEVRSGRSWAICSLVKCPVRSKNAPSGPIIALTPTVEICTTARPCSTARKRDMASCWVDSWVRPKEALLVGMTISSPPATTDSRMSWS